MLFLSIRREFRRLCAVAASALTQSWILRATLISQASSRLNRIGALLVLGIVSVTGSFAQGTLNELTPLPVSDAVDLLTLNDVIYSLTNSGKLYTFDSSIPEWAELATLPPSPISSSGPYSFMKMAARNNGILIFYNDGRVFEYDTAGNAITQLPNDPFITEFANFFDESHTVRPGKGTIFPVSLNDEVFIVAQFDTTSSQPNDSYVYIVRYSDGAVTPRSKLPVQLNYVRGATVFRSRIYLLYEGLWWDPRWDLLALDPNDLEHTEHFLGPVQSPYGAFDGAWLKSDGEQLIIGRRWEVVAYDDQDFWAPIWNSNSQDRADWLPYLDGLTIHNQRPFILHGGRPDSVTTFAEIIPDQSSSLISFSLQTGNISPLIQGNEQRANAADLIDLDGDTDLDLIVLYGSDTGYEITAYYNSGDGSFETGRLIENGWPDARVSDMAVRDIDNDGDRDIILGVSIPHSSNPYRQPTNWHRVLVNDGAGNFSRLSTSGPMFGGNFVVDDFDADGVLDVLFWDRNRGLHLLRSPVAVGGGNDHKLDLPFWPFTAEVGDLNRDGAPDVVLGRANTYTTLAMNNGNGQLRTTEKFGVDYGLNVAIGDVDQSGNVDIVVGGSKGRRTGSPTIFVSYLNAEGEIIDNVSQGNINEGVYDVKLADLDFDDDLDLIVTVAGDDITRVKILENDGRGHFLLITVLRPPATSTYFGALGSGADIVIGDVNGDLLPDIVLAAHQWTSGIVRNAVFINQTTAEIRLPASRPTELSSIIFEDTAEIEWEAVSDPLISYEISLARVSPQPWFASRGSPEHPYLLSSIEFNDLALGTYEFRVRYLTPSLIPSCCVARPLT